MKLKIWLICGAVLAAHAAVAAPQAETDRGGRKLVTVTRGNGAGHGLELPARLATLTPIYQNFATKYPRGIYNALDGVPIYGPPNTYYYAAAFTPQTTATVGEIDAAVGYELGTRHVVSFALYADDAGKPGRELWHHVATLPNGQQGLCCALSTVQTQSGPTLTAGTQYWLGIATVRNGSDTFAVWSLENIDEVNPVLNASNDGKGWQIQTAPPGVAFGIYAQ